MSAITGDPYIPAKVAAKVNQAIERLISQGDVDADQRWQALEQWADAALKNSTS